MAGILSFLQAAIQPAAAARAGYMQGQEQEKDKQRAQGIQDTAIKRQGILDQIRAQLDTSEIDRNRASADRYNRMNTPASQPPKTLNTDQGIMQWDPVAGGYTPTGYNSPAKAGAAPKTINTDQGIMQWDPASKAYKPTGFKAPAKTGKTGSSAQDRLDAKTALDEATKSVPRPSKVPATVLGTDAKGRTTIAPNPAVPKITQDSLDYESSTLAPLRQHLLDVTIGDKVKLGRTRGAGGPGATSSAGSPPPSGGATSSTSSTSSTYSMNGDQSKAMQGEFDAASADLNAVLNSGAPETVKQQARALYNKQQGLIAKKYSASGAGASSTMNGATTSASPDDQLDDDQP